MESDKIDLDKKSQPSCLGAVMPPKGKFNF